MVEVIKGVDKSIEIFWGCRIAVFDPPPLNSNELLFFRKLFVLLMWYGGLVGRQSKAQEAQQACTKAASKMQKKSIPSPPQSVELGRREAVGCPRPSPGINHDRRAAEAVS